MKKVLLAVVTTLGILFAGCNKDTGVQGDDGIGTLVVTLKSQNGTAMRGVGEPTLDQENTVHSFAIYVFNSQTGELEKSDIFYPSATGMVGTITDLRTSTTKKVVVLANYDYSLVGGPNGVSVYDDIDNGVLNMDSQIPGDFLTYGLFMSGELDNITITSGVTNAVTIPIARVVAKVRLGTLTVSPDAASTGNFQIVSVSMQKVPYWAYMLGDIIPTLDDDEYYGGIAGSVSQVSGDYPYMLYTPYTPTIVVDEELTPDIYFYVLPNDDSQQNATLLTIEAVYDGNTAYYTFAINNFDSGVAGETDGTFIKRNMIYTLNVTLRSLSKFTDDPDDDALADLEITVEIENWYGELIQNVVW